MTHMADGVINDVKQWEMVSFGLGIRVWRWLGAKMSFEKMESTNKLGWGTCVFSWKGP